MRIKTLFLAVLLSSMVVSLAAQDASRVAGSKAESGEVGGYYDEYAKSSTESVFITLPIKIFGAESRLDINARFSYPGRQLAAPPEHVRVVLSVPCELGNQLDSDPIFCVDAVCSGYRPRSDGVCAGGLLRERTSSMIDVPYEAFLKMAKARSVIIRLPSAEVELSREQIGTLRKLAERMLPRKDSSKSQPTAQANNGRQRTPKIAALL